MVSAADSRTHVVETEAGLVEWATGAIGDPLRGAVRGYTGYRENATDPVQRRESPTGQVVLIVSFGDQLRTQAATAGGGGAGGGGSLRAYTSFVAGLHDTPAATAHDGRQHGIQIGLDPPAAFALLGVPMHEIAGGAVELRELLGRTADRWTDQLATTKTWADRFGVLDQLLGEQISAGPVASPEIRWAWAELRRSAGQVRIGDLAEQVGCSHRHLVACFREQIGVTPKTAARVLRFQHARHLLDAGQSPAVVAARCRYSDQSHLSREFTRLAGCTPTPALTTILVYDDIAAAHNFLVTTFGLAAGQLARNAGGEVMHGEIGIGTDTVWLHRVSPEHGLGSVAKLGAATGMLNVFVADVDAHYTRVKAAGARIDFPPTDMPYGQREYAAFDCEGRIWSFATRT